METKVTEPDAEGGRQTAPLDGQPTGTRRSRDRSSARGEPLASGTVPCQETGELAAVRGPTPPHHGGLSLWAGTALVVLGVCVNVLAALQHAQSLKRLQAGQPLYPSRFSLGVVLALVLALLGAAMAIYLVFMP